MMFQTFLMKFIHREKWADESARMLNPRFECLRQLA